MPVAPPGSANGIHPLIFVVNCMILTHVCYVELYFIATETSTFSHKRQVVVQNRGVINIKSKKSDAKLAVIFGPNRQAPVQ